MDVVIILDLKIAWQVEMVVALTTGVRINLLPCMLAVGEKFGEWSFRATRGTLTMIDVVREEDSLTCRGVSVGWQR